MALFSRFFLKISRLNWRGFTGVLGPVAFLLLISVFLLPDSARASHSPCIALHEAAFMDEPTIVHELLDDGVSANCINEVGHTPLMTAIEGASESVVALLLAHGADPKALNGFGETPWQQARHKFKRFNEPLLDGQLGQLAESFRSMMQDIEKAEKK